MEIHLSILISFTSKKFNFDETESIVQHYVYSSYGKLLEIKGSDGADLSSAPLISTSYGFTGRELDQESGMMYYRARYYMPEIGRFAQEDPHPGLIGDPLSHNSKYAYAFNNPGLYVDPEGEFAFTTILIISAVSAAITSSFKEGNFLENFIADFATNVVLLTIGELVFAGTAFAGAGAGGAALSTNAAIAVGAIKGLKSVALSVGINTIHRNLGETEKEFFNAGLVMAGIAYGESNGYDKLMEKGTGNGKIDQVPYFEIDITK